MTQIKKVDPAQKVETALKNAARRELDAGIDEAYTNLFEQGAPHGVLPERIFVEKFLPFFSGQQKDDPKLQIMTHWVGIAGSPMNPVDIVNPAGKVVCTIPPMMTSDFIHKGGNVRGKTFSQIATDARRQSNRIPVLGDNMMKTVAVDKATAMKPETDSKEINQWNQVFQRYGVDTSKVNTVTGNSLTAVSDGSDELEFD